MGAEFYIVKPDKKELFYLGKHVEPFEGIRISASTADYIEHDCFHDFFLDVVNTNDGLLGGDHTYNQVKEFAYVLYEWCNDTVYLSSDCSEDFEIWKDYTETGSICDYLSKHLDVTDVVQKFVPDMPHSEVGKILEGLL